MRSLGFAFESGGKPTHSKKKLYGKDCNGSAIGSRIYLTSGGVTQIREVKSAKGHPNGQSSLMQHFGLGTNTVINEIKIKWQCGKEQIFKNPPVNKILKITEGKELFEE